MKFLIIFFQNEPLFETLMQLSLAGSLSVEKVLLSLPVSGNLSVVYDFAVAQEKYPAQVAIIKNGFGLTRTAKDIEQILSNKQYLIAGKWPHNKHIIKNIIEGRPWWSSMDARQRQPFLTFYSKVWTAWKRLLADDLETTWERS